MVKLSFYNVQLVPCVYFSQSFAAAIQNPGELCTEHYDGLHNKRKHAKSQVVFFSLYFF